MVKHKKHVLFLSRWYPHQYDSLLGLFVQRHAESVAIKSDVSVLYVCPVDENIKDFISYQNHNGVDEYIYYYSKKRPLQKLLSPIKYFRGLIILYKTLLKRKYKPDIIHVNILTRVGFFAYLLKRIYGIPYIITEHWSRYQDKSGGYKGILRKIITKLVVKNASAVTTVTTHLKNEMNKHGLTNKNWHIVPNVVDTDFFSLKPIDNVNTIYFNFIHVSSFEEKSKNLSGIIDAFHKLSKDHSNVRLFMVGEGIDFLKTKELSDKLDLTDKVIYFTGKLEGEQLIKQFHSSDAMLLYSNYENLPVVILEAMSCGLPIVTSDVGGIKEFFNEKCGIIIEPNRTDKLVEALDCMIMKAKQYNLNEIRNFAEERFSMEAISKKFNAIYDTIV